MVSVISLYIRIEVNISYYTDFVNIGRKKQAVYITILVGLSSGGGGFDCGLDIHEVVYKLRESITIDWRKRKD